MTACDCQSDWKFEGVEYSGCDKRKPKDSKPWCYVDGDESSCPNAKISTVSQGSYWRYCDGGADSVHVTIASNEYSEGPGGPGGDSPKPLERTMSEGARLRNLWRELGHIEAAIHTANQHLKARLIKIFKIIRAKMVKFENCKDAGDKRREGARLRAAWAELGHIEREIHITNEDMKRHLKNVINRMKEKMAVFDREASTIPGFADAATPALPGVESMEEVQLGMAPFSAIVASEEAVGGPPDAEMAPLKRTMSEGAKLRALWAELGHIEDEIHAANQVLKARLIRTFKVIRAHMVRFEQNKNIDQRKSEGSRLRAAWAQLGEIEKEIHICNIMMKRKLKRVIARLSAKMKVFDSQTANLHAVESSVADSFEF